MLFRYAVLRVIEVDRRRRKEEGRIGSYRCREDGWGRIGQDWQ